jgi:hypothetical protein
MAFVIKQPEGPEIQVTTNQLHAPAEASLALLLSPTARECVNAEQVPTQRAVSLWDGDCIPLCCLQHRDTLAGKLPACPISGGCRVGHAVPAAAGLGAARLLALQGDERRLHLSLQGRRLIRGRCSKPQHLPNGSLAKWRRTYRDTSDCRQRLRVPLSSRSLSPEAAHLAESLTGLLSPAERHCRHAATAGTPDGATAGRCEPQRM